MGFYKNLYLSDKVFYALGAVIGLFLLSFALPLLFYPAIVLLSLVVVVMIIDFYQLFKSPNIRAERQVQDILSLNEPSQIHLHVINLSPKKRILRLVDEIPFQFNRRDFSILQQIEANGDVRLHYTLTPQLRGEYRFGDLHAFVQSNIGLIIKKETSPCSRNVAVFPSIILMGKQQLLAMNHPSFLQGENKNLKLGQSYEFDQIKLYVPGDDTRNINWKASSTQNEVMVNCYEDERSQQIYSIIDKSRVMKTPFSGLTLVDYAINASLAFSNIVLKKQDKAGLLLFSKNIGAFLKADKGPRHLKKVMLALYKEKYDYSEANYEALYTSIKRNIPNRSLLFLYTNFDSIYALERNIPVLRLINKNHLLVVVFFENAELEAYSKTEADNLKDIYQLTIAKKFILEKNQIYKELQKHGIQAIKCTPENLSLSTINKYLELKSRGQI